MEKENIDVFPEKCAECMTCQLMCSLTYTGAFNPEEASIVVNSPDDIHFSNDCRDGCILCTKYCEYGAISVSKTKEGQNGI